MDPYCTYRSLFYSLRLKTYIIYIFPVIPHVTTEENVYEGFRIPVQSLVLANSR